MAPFDDYFKKLVTVCIDRGLSLRPLGRVGRQVVWMVRNVPAETPCKKLLIVAGTHGEEIAGPLGVLKFLEEVDGYLLRHAFLSIIPVVSPVVFSKRRQRTTKPNCGFVPGLIPSEKLSAEGQVLARQMTMLIRSAADGLLNLHETAGETHFYLYLMGENWGAAKDLLHTGLKYFDMIPEGEPMREPRSPRSRAWDGIVHNCLDGSLDHALWLAGVSPCITSETPGLKPLAKRIECTVDLIKTFIEIRGQK